MSDSEPMDNYERHYCLRWKYHHSNLQSMFAELLEEESFCDVTLACEGKTVRAHKLMLSASSPYFYTLFSQYEETEPIVILKDVKYDDLKTLIDFMYKGEIHVENSQLNSLLQTAKELQIKCLAAVSWLYEDGSLRRLETNQNVSSTNPNKVFTINKQVSSGKKRKAETEKETCNTSLKIPCIPQKSAVADDTNEKTVDTPNETDVRKNCENEIKEKKDEDSIKACTKEKEDIRMSGQTVSDASTVKAEDEKSLCSDERNLTSVNSVNTSNGEMKRFKDVVTMTQYIQQGGKRPNFWDIPSTKSVMEAIKNKRMEMKRAAVILGVSYGTLYGRYRDCYGYLKHPYRVREFWLEPGSLSVISQITRKEISLFKGAELLNISATSLANYLATLNPDTEEIEVKREDIKPLFVKEEKHETEAEEDNLDAVESELSGVKPELSS